MFICCTQIGAISTVATASGDFVYIPSPSYWDFTPAGAISSTKSLNYTLFVHDKSNMSAREQMYSSCST